MSKSSIKTKTVLTMIDMTESTELPDLKQKHGYKVTVKTEGVNKIIKYLIYFFLLTDSLFTKLYSFYSYFFDCRHATCLLMHYSGQIDDFLVCVLCPL